MTISLPALEGVEGRGYLIVNVYATKTQSVGLKDECKMEEGNAEQKSAHQCNFRASL